MSLEINTDDFWKEQQQKIEDWHSKLPKCGCGRIGRYETPTGLACNKYMRCDNAEFTAEQIKQLTEENARLRAALELALKGILFYSTEGAAKAGIDAANEVLKRQPLQPMDA